MRKYTFSRWFNHWRAFNNVAIMYNSWRFKYLFHDLDIPIMSLFCSSSYVKERHRAKNDHHVEYKGTLDLRGCLIDWECSGLTKKEAPMNAFETLNSLYRHNPNYDNLLKLGKSMRMPGFR